MPSVNEIPEAYSSGDVTPEPRRPKWVYIVGSVFSVLLLGWLLCQQDWRSIGSLVWGIGWKKVLLAQTLFFLGLVLNAIRWYGILALGGISVDMKRVLRLTFAGLFASNFLPSTVGGDVVRVFGLRKEQSVKKIFASVIIDRIFNVMGVICFVPLSLKTFWGMLHFSGILSGIWIPSSMTRLAKKILRFFNDILSWRREQRWLLFLYGIAVSVVSLLVPYTAIWILARGLQIPVTLAQTSAAAVLIYFAGLLPISINGYGVTELAFVSAFTWLGASIPQAASLALLFRVQMMLATLPGALWLAESGAGLQKSALE